MGLAYSSNPFWRLQDLGVAYTEVAVDETRGRLWPFVTELVFEQTDYDETTFARLHGRFYAPDVCFKFLWDLLWDVEPLTSMDVLESSTQDVDEVFVLPDQAGERAALVKRSALKMADFRGSDYVIVASPSLKWACFFSHEPYDPWVLKPSSTLLEHFVGMPLEKVVARDFAGKLTKRVPNFNAWWERSVTYPPALIEWLQKHVINYRFAEKRDIATARQLVTKQVREHAGMSPCEFAGLRGRGGPNGWFKRPLWRFIPYDYELNRDARVINRTTQTDGLVMALSEIRRYPTVMFPRQGINMKELAFSNMILVAAEWTLVCTDELEIGPFLLPRKVPIKMPASFQ